MLRTVPPSQVHEYATLHDKHVRSTLEVFLAIVGQEIPDSNDWTRQMQLPFRYGGMSLRSAARTSPAAYWGSWTDSIETLMQRFPDRGVRLLHELEHADATAPAAVRDVHASVEHLDRHGFRERESGARPTWKALAEGARPESIGDAIDPGNWPHDWQYHATDVLEQHEHKSLLSTFKRASAASSHVARLRSCAES